MPGNEKTCMGEYILVRSTGNNLGKKQKHISRKSGGIRNKTFENLSDQDCAVYLMKTVKMHLSKS